MKNHKDMIKEIESQCDVNSIKYKGYQLWPLIRTSIYEQLHHPGINVTNQKISLPAGNPGIDSTYISNWSLYQEEQTRLRQTGKVDMLFFTRHEEHSSQIAGNYYNPCIDPVINLVKDRYKTIKIERQTSKVKETIPRVVDTEFIEPLYYFNSVCRLKHLEVSNENASIDHFDELAEIVFKVTGFVRLNHEYFLYRTEIFEDYQIFFRHVLSELNPRIVFLVCYYHDIAMALINVCKERAITSVDIQHGLIPANHHAYTCWTKAPETGYDLLPDFFWCWGEESRKNIDNWRVTDYLHHRPVVGGNLCLSEWIQPNPVEAEYRDDSFIKRIKSSDKVILVTLSHIKEPLQDYLLIILETIKISSKGWLWLLRLHPRDIDQGQSIKLLNDRLGQQGIQNYEIESSSKYQLYLLLKNSTFHVSYGSTVCYESLTLDIPTVLVNSEGLGCFSEYVNKGVMFGAKDSKELFSLLNQSNVQELMVRLDEPYIETDSSFAEYALRRIVNYNQDTISLRSSLTTTNEDKESAVELNHRGRELFDSGSISSSVNMYKKAVKMYPGFIDSYINLGELFFETEDFQKSLYFFTLALKIAPGNRKIVLNCGKLLVQFGRFKEAGKLFSHFLLKCPDDKEVSDKLMEYRSNGKVV